MMDPASGAARSVQRPLAEYLGFLLRRAHNAAVEVSRRELPAECDPRGYAVLTVLDHRGAASQQQIAELLHINRTLVVKLVDHLETAGFVVRRRDSVDRRAYALALTSAGQASIVTCGRAIQQGDAVLTAGLTSGDVLRLNQLLRRLLPDPTLGDVPGVGTCTAFLITRAHQHRRDLGRTALAPTGLEPRHFGALASIDELGTCTQQQLAQHMGISPPVILGVVDELDTNHQLERVRSVIDRRAYQINLSTKGRTQLDDARDILEIANRDLEQLLGPQGSGELNTLLRKLIQHPRTPEHT